MATCSHSFTLFNCTFVLCGNGKKEGRVILVQTDHFCTLSVYVAELYWVQEGDTCAMADVKMCHVVLIKLCCVRSFLTFIVYWVTYCSKKNC